MANTIRVPNQKKILSIIKEPCDEKHFYAKINLDALHTAMMRLSGEHFKVWLYFAENQPQYSFLLSSKDVCEACCISRNTYDKAIAKLIENGYLIKNGETNDYFFRELPLLEK